MSAELATQYPHLTAALAPHVDGWAGLSPDERDAWILEALANMDEQRDDIEVGSRFSITGHSFVVELGQPMLATIRDAAASASSAQRHLERVVAVGARGVGSIVAVADAAGVTRQTVYRWAKTE